MFAEVGNFMFGMQLANQVC